MLLEHMHKKFQINRTKIKGGCQLARKVVAYDSKSDKRAGRKIIRNLINEQGENDRAGREKSKHSL